jgi:N6-adenosine-specific RNA methylase IME4
MASTWTAAKQKARAEREAALASSILILAPPNQSYGVILADPGWRFEPYSRETGMARAADNHYVTEPTNRIEALDIPSIAAKDCCLFLWATAPMLPDALRVMASWGFQYKSQFVWVKDRIGTGYWTRNKHEHLLIGSRGQIPAPGPERNGLLSSKRRSERIPRNRNASSK